MTQDDAVVELEDVVVRGGERTILRIERLVVRRGERVALIGASGAGKTTLLRLIKGFVRLSAGRVRVLGRELPVEGGRAREQHQQIGMIHQHFDLIARENVWRNVMHGRLGRMPLWRSVLGLYGAADEQICLAAIDEVQLGDKLERQARSLSGGEQQRTAIARAVAQQPELLLADEPVSSLDPGLAASVLELLTRVADLHGLTLLMSLHLPELARRFGRRVIALRAGSVLWDGPAEDLSPERLGQVYRASRAGGAADVEWEAPVAPHVGWAHDPLGQPVPGV